MCNGSQNKRYEWTPHVDFWLFSHSSGLSILLTTCSHTSQPSDGAIKTNDLTGGHKLYVVSSSRVGKDWGEEMGSRRSMRKQPLVKQAEVIRQHEQEATTSRHQTPSTSETRSPSEIRSRLSCQHRHWNQSWSLRESFREEGMQGKDQLHLHCT